MSPVARISQVSFPSSGATLASVSVSSHFFSPHRLRPFLTLISLLSFRSPPSSPHNLSSPVFPPTGPALSLPLWPPVPVRHPTGCLSCLCLPISLLISASLSGFFRVILPCPLHPRAQCRDHVTKSPTVTGVSEGQEGCPQAGPVGRVCSCPRPGLPAPARELSLLRTRQAGPWCPPHAHTCSQHTHSPPSSPALRPLCAPPSLSPHVLLSPCHQCRVLHGHTCSHVHITCVGAVSATGRRPHADSALMRPLP